jgi:uncharacterized small protein (DUF1192 family)
MQHATKIRLPAKRTGGMLAVVGMLVLTLGACDGASRTELEQRVATLQRELAAAGNRVAHLEGEVAALAAQLTAREREIEDLRTTEEAMWGTVLALRTAGDLDEAEEAAVRLIARYPSGEHRAAADVFLASVDDERAQQLVGEARWYLREGQTANARAIFQRVLDEHSASVHADDARSGLADVVAREAQAAAEAAGFVIEEVETFWSTNADTLGGRALIQPELRFYVRPAAGAALDYLQLRAVYYLSDDDGTEEFGDATTYLVGSSDVPLQPSVRKQARMTSGVGYVYNSLLEMRFAQGGTPDVSVEVFFKRSYSSPWTHFYSADVSNSYQY